MRKFLLLIVSVAFAAGYARAGDIKRELDSIVSKWEYLEKFSGSVAVLQHGEVLLNKGYGVSIGNTGKVPHENTLYLIGESTEMFTAAMIFKLFEDGKLALNDKLTKYIPELKEYDAVTIKDLLTHRSGIPDYFTSAALGNVFVTHTRTDIMNIIAGKTLMFTPGTTYNNSFSNYYVLGLIIERITNKPYGEALQQYILKPLDIKDAGFDFNGLASWDKAQGHTILSSTRMIPAFNTDSTIGYSAAGLFMSANGMYKWAKAALGYKLLKKSSWQVMTNELGNNYGHGWESRDVFGKKAIGHTGEVPGFISNFYFIREDSTIIIILSNDFESETDYIFEQLTAALYKQPYTLPEKRIPVFLEQSRLEYYAGTYAFEDGTNLNIYIKEGQLWGKMPNMNEFTIVADIIPDEFFMNSVGTEYKFHRDKKTNLVTHVVVRTNRKESIAKKWQ